MLDNNETGRYCIPTVCGIVYGIVCEIVYNVPTYYLDSRYRLFLTNKKTNFFISSIFLLGVYALYK